jgi:GWxTD domain-containing protein
LGSLARLLAASALLCLAGGCGSAGPPAGGTATLASWAEGPVRWLLLPGERRQARRIDSAADSVHFIEHFWRRRDPDLCDEANPVRETFRRRVDAADQLYAEQSRRGSLSDRGGALILLGAPSHLHVTSRPVLSWDATAGEGERVTREQQSYEIWGYRLSELEPALVDLVQRRRGDEALRLQLTFVRSEDRTYLVEGGELLELAARALVLWPEG